MDITGLFDRVKKFFFALVEKFFGFFPSDKKWLPALLLGCVFLLITVLTVASAIGNKPPKAHVLASGIPADELFYPAEPEFVPALLLEREPSPGWTAEDIEQFWIDPGLGHEEQWRDTIRGVVDRLMEGVQ